MTQAPAPIQPVALTVRGEELVLEVRIGEKAVSVQLTPQAALELAHSLLGAGLEHGARRAAMCLEAEHLADLTVRKAAH